MRPITPGARPIAWAALAGWGAGLIARDSITALGLVAPASPAMSAIVGAAGIVGGLVGGYVAGASGGYRAAGLALVLPLVVAVLGVLSRGLGGFLGLVPPLIGAAVSLAVKPTVTARSAILEGLGAFLIARELLALDVLARVPGTSRTSVMTLAAVLAAVVLARRAAKPWLDALMVSAIVVLVHVLPTLIAILRAGVPRLDTIVRAQWAYDLGAAVAIPLVASLIALLMRRAAVSSGEV